MKNFLNFLNTTELFNGFNNKQLTSLFKTNRYNILMYKKGSIIHFESEKCNSLDIILTGEVNVQKIDKKGNVLSIAKFKVGENMGGNLLFSDYPYYPMSVFAKSDCEIIHINRDFVLDLCQNNKHFLLKFLTCISDKTTILTNKLKSVTMKSIRESVIDFLNSEYMSQKSKRIKLNMTKKELAEKLGVQRTSLSRELNKMKKDGLVDYDARSITICDLNIIKNL